MNESQELAILRNYLSDNNEKFILQDFLVDGKRFSFYLPEYDVLVDLTDNDHYTENSKIAIAAVKHTKFISLKKSGVSTFVLHGGLKAALKKDHKLVILSGGLDSTVVLYDVVKKVGSDRVTAISFDYGQVLNIELELARKTCQLLGVKHQVIPLDFVQQILFKTTSLIKGGQDLKDGEEQNTYVPFRNMLFFNITLLLAEAAGNVDAIYSGIQPHSNFETYWDTTPRFLQGMEHLANMGSPGIRIFKAPFLYSTKAKIVKRGIELGVPFENTHTCYRGEAPACGTCPSCRERLEAFEKSGVPDPIKYANTQEIL
jgi:7-cyano-7-deazaguanine synthase